MRPVLIVAHGQPSDPMPAAEEIAQLAQRVAACLPGRSVGSATLAQPGAIVAQIRSLGQAGLVYPLFMAGGWFTRVLLPSRMAEAGAVGWQVLEPLGCDPALHRLAVQIIEEAVMSGGLSARETKVLLAAHGSFKSAVPSDIARHLASLIRSATQAGLVEAAFIDQDPQLAQAVGFGVNSVCLPFFAASGGHVATDIPAALAAAGFAGRLLPPIGTDARVPALIARAIEAAQPICQTVCRYKS